MSNGVSVPEPDAAEWIGLVANARSGRGKARRRVALLRAELAAQGLRTRVSWTRSERTRLVQAANHDQLCRGLVAIGGDGTVSALINEQPLVPISVLPTGTENLFARHFGMPARPDTLSRTLAQGEVGWMDLGLMGERRFALMAGFGFDAAVVTRHHSCRVGPNGMPRPTCRSSYVEPVLSTAWSYPFPVLQARVLDPGAEEVIEGTTLFVFNLPRYALGLPFVPQAREDDGCLDLLVFQKPGAIQALRYLWQVWRRRHLRTKGVLHRRVREVEISARSEVPIQLDGDPGGTLATGPRRVQVLPRALAVRAPRAAVPARGPEAPRDRANPAMSITTQRE